LPTCSFDIDGAAEVALVSMIASVPTAQDPR
jgi:hypothetical protein